MISARHICAYMYVFNWVGVLDVYNVREYGYMIQGTANVLAGGGGRIHQIN